MRSNRRKNWFIKRIALGVAIAAFAAPAAQGAVVEGASSGTQAVTAGEFGMPRAMPSDYVLRRDPVELVRSQHRSTGNDIVAASFDWKDAGIGAGLALGLVLLGWGAALAMRRLGRPQTA